MNLLFDGREEDVGKHAPGALCCPAFFKDAQHFVNAPGGSGQQPHTDFLFEVAHRMADCGGSDTKSLCSFCKTALLRNGEKHG